LWEKLGEGLLGPETLRKGGFGMGTFKRESGKKRKKKSQKRVR